MCLFCVRMLLTDNIQSGASCSVNYYWCNAFSIQRTGLSRSLEQAMNMPLLFPYIFCMVFSYSRIQTSRSAGNQNGGWSLSLKFSKLNHGVKLRETKGISSQNSLFDVLVLG